MALKASKALRNGMLATAAFRQLMTDCVLNVYTGSQPASADAAVTGTLLCTYTNGGVAFVNEVRAAGTITLSGGSGSVDSVTVAGIEILGAVIPFNSDLTQTALDVATQINYYHDHKIVTASASGAVVTLTAQRGFGTDANGLAVVSATTTMVGTDVNIGTAVAGVDAVNGLNWDVTAAGVITKAAAEVWEGDAVATGTAGWFRFTAATADPGTLDSSELYPRLDGAVGTSGAELNLTNLSFVDTVPQVITSFALTFPTS